MKILLFLPSSHQAYDILSQAMFLSKKGYHSIILSTTPKGEVHRLCDNYDINNNSLSISSLNIITYIPTAFKLARYVHREKIDLILSNNLQGNFVAVLAQLIHHKRTILTRHHTDYIFTGSNRNAKRQQRFVNRFGKEFIAISGRVKAQMINEGISTKKIHRIDLGFDFGLYKSIDQNVIDNLIKPHKENFKLCLIARLIPLKRHQLLFEAIKIIHDKGIKVILWVIGDGPLINELKEWVRFNRLENAILFTGFINNPENYLSASDLLVHISKSEASSHVIREAALVDTPVLVCKDVGDNEDYIIDNENGFFVEKLVTPEKLAEKIVELSNKNEILKQSVVQLKKTIFNRFDINENGYKLLKIIENE